VKVLFDLGACLRGNRVVDQIVKNGKKLSAGHLATPAISKPKDTGSCRIPIRSSAGHRQSFAGQRCPGSIEALIAPTFIFPPSIPPVSIPSVLLFS